MRLKPRSLYGQIILAQSFVVIVIAAILTFGLSYLLHQTADDFVANHLRRDAHRVAMEMAGGGRPMLPPPPFAPPFGPPPHGWRPGFDPRHGGGHAFGILNAKGDLIASGGPPLPPEARTIPREWKETFFHRGRLNVLSMPVGWPKPKAWVVVAQDDRNPDEMVNDVVASFLSRVVWLVPLTIISLLALTILVARQSTRAIARVSREADLIGPDRLDQRLTVDDLPAEARSLAGATNRALDRLENAYVSQSEFVSNVAHELRTPLALIALRAEVADEPLKAQLLVGVQRAAHVIDQLLELASLENTGPAPMLIDLCETARNTVEHYVPIVLNSGRTIAFDAGADGSFEICLPTGIVEIALGNLIDNAIRHTPTATHIIVSVDAPGSLRVTDNGPGIAADQRSDARKRYWRADTSRSDSAGLGLAIVERIMSAHHGELIIAPSASGGASVTLAFIPD
jgi:two-component system OmpR family sensor kinase